MYIIKRGKLDVVSPDLSKVHYVYYQEMYNIKRGKLDVVSPDLSKVQKTSLGNYGYSAFQ